MQLFNNKVPNNQNSTSQLTDLKLPTENSSVVEHNISLTNEGAVEGNQCGTEVPNKYHFDFSSHSQCDNSFCINDFNTHD